MSRHSSSEKHVSTKRFGYRTSLSMEIAFGVLAAQFLQAAIQTVTVDRGKEFACLAVLTAVHG
nr:hypothetical protein [Paenibacillus xylanexedens]